MPDLLLELFSEEIPARMQARAAEDLKKLVTDALVERGLLYEGARTLVTPRRLALHVAGLPLKGSDVLEERKGPRVGAPEQAVLGFLKSAGLSSLDEAKIETDPKKGDFYVAVVERPGQNTIDVLADVLPAIIRAFPWPKSMRWGAASAQPGALRWVRPLQSIVAVFGAEGEDPQVVRFEVDGVAAGDVTYGHRFHAPGPIRVKRLDDYVAKLEAARVVADPERRKQIIRTDARHLAFAQGLEVVEDEGLLDEVAGLVEWPVVLMGDFDPAFLEVPAEAIRATIRANQKCFVLKDGKTGKLAPKFLLTANVAASDGGATIIAGNGRVIRARLSDARFFWETDRKVQLEERLKKLDSVTFHARLGSQGERVRRIVALAGELAPLIGADPALAKRAALLAKADLSTEMVGEFPELQGLMGRYYAALQGETDAVAAAIEDHYKPLGPSDRVPSEPVSIAVALADKLDTLTGFWSIDEKPTGSKDPYALRRAALGVIRLIVDNGLRLPLAQMVTMRLIASVMRAQRGRETESERSVVGALEKLGSIREVQAALGRQLAEREGAHRGFIESLDGAVKAANAQGLDLMAFFADRLKVQLRESGARHDLVDAVFALQGQDDLLMVVRRVEALGAFLESEDGKNLLAGYRRAANILRAEEKKDGAGAFAGQVDAALLGLPAEAGLFAALQDKGNSIRDWLAKEQFRNAMQDMASLRPAVDAFFEAVMVNADDPALRQNRLRLLTYLREIMHRVADFSKVAG